MVAYTRVTSKTSKRVAEKYKKNYAKYIYKAPKASMEPLAGQDLEQVAKHAEETAGGMDMWTPAYFKFLPRAAIDELARLLNMIEE